MQQPHIKKKSLFFRYYSTLNDPELKGIMLDSNRVSDDLSDLNKLFGELSDKNRIILMSGLMNCLPLRIARGLYFDYISKNLSETFAYLSESEIDNYIEFCEIFFDPNKLNTGKFTFDDITADMRKLDAYDEYCNIGTDFSDDIKEIFENEFFDLNKVLDELTYHITVLFETTNYLLIMLNFAINFGYLTDDNFIVKDLYFLIKEAFGNSAFAFDDDIFAEKIETETIKVLDSIEDSSEHLKKELKKAMNNGKFKNDETLADEHKFLFMYDFAYQLFYEALYDIDEIMFKSVKPGIDKEAGRYELISKDLAESKIGQLAEIIKTSSPDASVRNRKLERQFFLEYVPCFLTIEEFHKYIVNSFDNSSQVEILSAMGSIHGLLEAYGAGRDDYEEGHYDDHGDCDCGDHNHHHTHHH